METIRCLKRHIARGLGPTRTRVCLQATDLPVDVDPWYGFSGRFTHRNIGEPAEDKKVLYATLTADGVDPGPGKMAEDGSGYGSHHPVKLPTVVYSRVALSRIAVSDPTKDFGRRVPQWTSYTGV